MKEYAKDFYTGKQWKKISRLYMARQHYVCERCGGGGGSVRSAITRNISRRVISIIRPLRLVWITWNASARSAITRNTAPK